MTNRDRLIELIQKEVKRPKADALADHLLANGVIVPPCKVGDTVWYKEPNYILCSYTVISVDATKWGGRVFAYNISMDVRFDFEDFGKTVFLTKEEAEAKLKERDQNAR